MNPILYIKKFGVYKARKIVDGTPEGTTHIVGSSYLKLIGAVWWNAWLPEWSHKENCMVHKWKGESIEEIEKWGEVFKLEEIKNIIKNLDLVTAWGGIDATYSKFKHAKEVGNLYAVKMIEDAIKDFKSVYACDYCNGDGFVRVGCDV